MFEQNPMLIITSDVHLGGGNNLLIQFRQFLQEILRKIRDDANFNANFKALIILGDCFDLLMDSYRNICHSDGAIHETIEGIHAAGKHILFVLGNHEVSVSGNYNKHFRERKIELLHAFERNVFPYSYLKDAFIGQYLILQPNPLREWEISIFETNHFHLSPLSKFSLGLKPPIGTNQAYLMAHGYQFYRAETQFYGIFAWNGLLNAADPVKEAINFIYNESGIREMVKEGIDDSSSKIKDAFAAWRAKAIDTSPILQKMKSVNQLMFKTLFFNMVKFEHDRRHFRNSDKLVLKYLDTKPLSHISHVIYGHTHQCGKTSIEKKVIFNTGAWQNVDRPSYVEILANGETELRLL